MPSPANAPAIPSDPPAPNRYAVLAFRDFRLALVMRFFDWLTVSMVGIAVPWQVFKITHDPLALGFIGLAQSLPFIAAALWSGKVVDGNEKRIVMLVGQTGILASFLGLLALAYIDASPVRLFYLCLAGAGLCRSYYYTARSAYIQTLIPRDLYPHAAVWDTGVLQAAAIVGPLVGGLLMGRWGLRATLICVVALCIGTLVSAMQMTPMPTEYFGEAPSSGGSLSGIRFVIGNRIVLGAMALDMFSGFFGGVDGVLPIFAARLGASAMGFGLMKAAAPVGALACSIFLAHARPIKETGRAFIWSVTAFGLSMIAFAVSRQLLLSCLILIFGGAMDAIGIVLRLSIYQAETPNNLRGRVAAVSSVFVKSSSEIGVFESGLAARLMGLVPSVVFGGFMAMVSVGLALKVVPDLYGFRFKDSAGPR